MIGDGLGTDIAAAIAVGARSILMLTGVTTRARGSTPRRADGRPTAVAADAARARGDPRATGLRRAVGSQLRDARRPGVERAPERREVASSANATSRAWRSIAQSSSGVRPIWSSARSYSSVSDRSDTVVSSVESVTDTPSAVEAGERMRRDRGDDAGLPVRGRAEVERDAAGDQLARRGPGRRSRPGRGRSAPGRSRARAGPGPRRPIRRRGG